MKKVLKEILSTSIYLLVVLIGTYLFIHFVAQRTIVKGSSMEPTLVGTDENDQDKVGDNLIVDKISYRFSEPERFEIIVFPYKLDNGQLLIKRIIGLPGETVEIREDGFIYINGEQLKEGYGKEIINSNHLGAVEYPIVLGKDEYFVLGDNRNNSSDSRYPMVGNVHKDDIVGRAFFRIWPFSKIGLVH